MEYVYQPTVYRYNPYNFISNIFNAIIGIIEFMLAVRIVLTLLGANQGAPFVAWIYNVTDAMVAPFAGAFPAWNLGGFVLDLSAIFAMIGYAIIGWLVIRLLSLIFASLYNAQI